MRSIGQLRDGGLARRFSDFLVARGVPNEVEHENDGSWSVWIRDEDQVAMAKPLLERFTANPDTDEFREAGEQATKIREADAAAQEEYRKRVRTRRSLFPKFGGYGIGFLTYALMALCMFMFVFSNMGDDHEALRPYLIANPDRVRDRSLTEVGSGEVWRLVTPIFIHFGVLHLLFNMMWMFQLGGMIEGRQGTLRLAVLVVATAVISNLAQFFWSAHSHFGGMSGVVYGLAGYVWIRGRFDPASGLFLDTQSVTILLVWMVLCFTNFMPIANAAHVAGLLVGMSCGWVSAQLSSRKSD